MKVKLTFCGGVGAVTGANFLLEVPECRLLVDCGFLQGVAGADVFNAGAFSYDVGSIDHLFITHAHMDHIGRVPKLVKSGFRGTIVSTPPTLELARVMLDDAASLADADARKTGTMPLYEKKDVDAALALWKTTDYHEVLKLKGDLQVVAKDAGHILGSAMYEFSTGKAGEKIIFTGDMGNSPALFLNDTESPAGASYLVMESVYGDRNHESKEARRARLLAVIADTIARKRTLIIPAFSLERTQDILYELNKMIEEKQIASVPVFLDSPLAEKVTEIYRANSRYFKESARAHVAEGDDLFSFPSLRVSRTSRDSQAIDRTGNPKIIIAGSGMSSGGRVTHHEKISLPDPNATILLVGYQSLGTLGRKLQEGAKSVDVLGETVPVRASIQMISGYSSHKDSDHLIDFVSQADKTLKKVFVAMGEPKSSLFLVQRLRDYLDIDASAPTLGTSVEIEL